MRKTYVKKTWKYYCMIWKKATERLILKRDPRYITKWNKQGAEQY